ncbi:MAG: PhoX family phosphatase [Acidimicrobiales bacterium]
MTSTEHPTTPSNEFSDLVRTAVSRRAVLTGGMATAVAAFFGGGVGSLLTASPSAAEHPVLVPGLIGFTPIAPSIDDAVVVPPGYAAQVLYRWGDSIQGPGTGPEFKLDASNTAAEQAQQAGTGHDGIEFFPLPGVGGSQRGLLVLNHEFAESFLLFADGDVPWTADKTAKSQAAHGVSVIEVRLDGGQWTVVPSTNARRITASTPMTVAGPAAGHALLQTSADVTGRSVLGTVNNCAVGRTPWSTYLTCEENFNAYFGSSSTTVIPSALMKRYGIGKNGFGPDWWKTDTRFDIAMEPNESNRFGWVVEIDPFDPTSTPVKRTALGRLKHENALFTESRNGRAVVYTGDDERGEFIYKFVSARPWRDAIAAGTSPLDEGVLYAARFENGKVAGDGKGIGKWLPLVQGQGTLTAANGWPDQATVLVNARAAATAMGATRMDRPEWFAVDPNEDTLYCTLTNNTNRGTSYPTDDANPRATNRYGHIIRWDEKRGDHATTLPFEWDLFVLAGDPAQPAHGATAGIDAFGSPDGLGFDGDSRLWIQTDGTQPIICNNQMLAADPGTGDIRRFLVGPKGCEITGLSFTPDQRTAFINIQHPGEDGTVANPRLQSNWPDFQPDGRPRDATVVIRRVDGGVIGT